MILMDIEFSDPVTGGIDTLNCPHPNSHRVFTELTRIKAKPFCLKL